MRIRGHGRNRSIWTSRIIDSITLPTRAHRTRLGPRRIRWTIPAPSLSEISIEQEGEEGTQDIVQFKTKCLNKLVRYHPSPVLAAPTQRTQRWQNRWHLRRKSCPRAPTQVSSSLAASYRPDSQQLGYIPRTRRSLWLLPVGLVLNGWDTPRTRMGLKYWTLLDRRVRCNLFVQILSC